MRSVTVTVAAAIAVGACTFSKQDSGNFVSIPDERGRIVVDAPVYATAAPTRVGFVDGQEREEYALFRTTGGQAEIFYAETRQEKSSNVALQFVRLVGDTVKMWRFNQGQELAFEPAYTVATNLTEFWVKPYVQTAIGRSCIGFYGTWDTKFTDPKLRPSKVLFGYHCVPKGRKIDRSEAVAMVKSIQIRGISVPLRIKTAYDLKDNDAPLPPREEQVAQLVIAQDGIGGGVAGLPDFPLLIARVFVESEGICVVCN